MTARYVLEDQIGHLFRRSHQRASQIFQENFADADLTPTQWAALAKLYERGALSQNHLGRLTAMDPATIQGVARRLMKRGLVERRADPDDRRRASLDLSGAGRDLCEALHAAAFKVSADTLEPLDEAEQRQFLALLRKLA
ncbi:MAG: winged helix-turn-helix transcriptional regulator [Rhodospirillaceae bacterium]|jgi:MarR family transcriptional regulator, lower aerobic nicotinate degradation pathway regulator|nr:winged helix-turn-helix transcriptional regulator [Rhodospirillaceae bacterium]MBT6139794.1 winged helix-turn-helix transcriptional regulator [Rhodospirillaceae bacterium]